jgi:hypothetical protein
LRYQKKYSSPPCPKCGSQNTITKRYDTGRGSREFICKDCGKCFSIRINPEQKPSMKAVAKTKTNSLLKPVKNIKCSQCGQVNGCICGRIEEHRAFMKEALNLDSCLDVPCFLCLEESRHCTESCVELENFLVEVLLK